MEISFRDEWKKDCKIGTNLLEEAESVYVLHNKYMVYMDDIKKKYKKYKILYNRSVHDYTEYYTGKYNTNSEKLKELSKDPLPNIIPSGKIQSFVDNEMSVIKLKNVMDQYEDDLYFLEQIIKALNSRVYQVKTILDIMKFESGTMS